MQHGHFPPATPLTLAGRGAPRATQSPRRASLLLEQDPASDLCLWVCDIDHPAHDLRSGVTTSITAAATAGLSALLDQIPTGPVLLLVHDRSHGAILEQLQQLTAETRISVLATSFRRSDILMQHALLKAPWRPPEPDPWVGTDGSAGGRRSSRAGWAWVRADGTYDAGTCPGDSQAAEFLALRRAVSALPSTLQPRATVVSDCQGSIARWHRQQHLGDAGQVQLAWVPGHVGHPLNEASDRLARLARRCSDANIPFSKEIAGAIVSEMRAQIAAAPTAYKDLQMWRDKAAGRYAA